MTKILDRETLSKVLAAEPVVAIAPEILPKLVVKALESETLNPRYAQVASVQTGAFWIPIKDLAKDLAQYSLEISPARVGRVVDGLGLRSVRTRDGFRAYWNRQQLVILKNALGV